MSVSVQNLYSRITEILLEPGGFVLGVFTEAQFLHVLAAVAQDFAQRSPLDKKIFTTMVNAGVSEYVMPDDVMKPELCFIGGKLIEKSHEAELARGHIDWRRQTGPPRQWHEDSLAVKRLELFPTPDFNGANIPGDTLPIGKYGEFYPAERNLTVIGPGGPNKTAWTLADSIDIPASFGPYLMFGVLEQIFSSESELRDLQRATYCRARYEEGIEVSKQIAQVELMEEE